MARNANAKIVQIAERQVLDRETGEIVQSEQERILQIPREPAYVKMYIDDLGEVLGVPQGPRGLIYHLARRVDYNGLISLTPGVRRHICQEAGIKAQSLSNYLTTLVKHDILYRTASSEYTLNPKYFARGDWREIYKRRQSWKMTVVYNFDGRKTVTGQAVDQLDLEDFLADEKADQVPDQGQGA